MILRHKNIFITLFFLILTTGLEAAPNPSKSRYEIGAGWGKLDYLETRNFGLLKPSAQSQTGYSARFNWQYFFIPPVLDFELMANYQDGSLGTTESNGNQVQFLEVTYKIGFNFPMIADRFAFGIAGDLYHIENLNPHEEFSMQRHFMFRFYPTFAMFPSGFETDINYSFYIRKPLYQAALEGDEFSAGFVIYLPLGGSRGLRYPLYAYQKMFTLRVDYTNLEIVFNRTELNRINTYDIEKITVQLGFNF